MAMLSYILRRLLYMIVLLVILSVVMFVIIQLPPGDYATAYIMQMKMRGAGDIDEEQIAAIRKQYGLDLPIHGQYVRWVRVWRGATSGGPSTGTSR